MGSQPDDAALSDAELITLVRGGDRPAFGTLYARHSGAATNLARQFARSPSEVDDLVSEAFARVLDTLLDGRGPDTAFRAYLFTTLRHTAFDRTRKDSKLQFTDDVAAHETAEMPDDPVVLELENSLVGRAFRSLPERWQAVLWHTQVEQEPPETVGELLGITANAVTSLAFRAREGLREGYLQAHLADTAAERCRATVNRLGSWARGGLSKREKAQVDAHLDECDDCRALADELVELNTSLRGVLAPLLLGGAATGYLATAGAHAAAAGALAGTVTAGVGGTAAEANGAAHVGPVWWASHSWASHSWAIATAAGTAMAAAVAAVLIVTSGGGHHHEAASPAAGASSDSPGAHRPTSDAGAPSTDGNAGAFTARPVFPPAAGMTRSGTTSTGTSTGTSDRASGVSFAATPPASSPTPAMTSTVAEPPRLAPVVAPPTTSHRLPSTHPGTPPNSSSSPTSAPTSMVPTTPASTTTAPPSPASLTPPQFTAGSLTAAAGGTAHVSIVATNSGGTDSENQSVHVITPHGISVTGFSAHQSPAGSALRGPRHAILVADVAESAGAASVDCSGGSCTYAVAAHSTLTVTLSLAISPDAEGGAMELLSPDFGSTVMPVVVTAGITGLRLGARDTSWIAGTGIDGIPLRGTLAAGISDVAPITLPLAADGLTLIGPKGNCSYGKKTMTCAPVAAGHGSVSFGTFAVRIASDAVGTHPLIAHAGGRAITVLNAGGQPITVVAPTVPTSGVTSSATTATTELTSQATATPLAHGTS